MVFNQPYNLIVKHVLEHLGTGFVMFLRAISFADIMKQCRSPENRRIALLVSELKYLKLMEKGVALGMVVRVLLDTV